jgi:hypothetical protein
MQHPAYGAAGSKEELSGMLPPGAITPIWELTIRKGTQASAKGHEVGHSIDQTDATGFVCATHIMHHSASRSASQPEQRCYQPHTLEYWAMSARAFMDCNTALKQAC